MLGLPKLEAFADDKLNATQNVGVVLHRIENIVGKEENAGYQHFLLFPQCFQTAFSSGVSKVVIVWQRFKKKVVVGFLKNQVQLLCVQENHSGTYAGM